MVPHVSPRHAKVLVVVKNALLHSSIIQNTDIDSFWMAEECKRAFFYYHQDFCVVGTYAWRHLVVGNVHGGIYDIPSL